MSSNRYLRYTSLNRSPTPPPLCSVPTPRPLVRLDWIAIASLLLSNLPPSFFSINASVNSLLRCAYFPLPN
ncbi:hypothetical protein H9L39_01179 [Fusarium oxysporum f. sp. albedinis]|nr:hypothetical protein H9L39_01179 [Fusarium oxysporum f. sp. albedinis]